MNASILSRKRVVMSALLSAATLTLFLFAAFLISVPRAQAADTINTSTYLDLDGNGTVDRIRWVMDENVTACTYDVADWTVNTNGSINVAVTGLSCTGSNANLDILVSADSNETGGATSPQVSYANAGTPNSITLTSGNMAAHATVTATDAAKPVALSAAYKDIDANGTVDRVDITTTTENGLTCTYETADWTEPVAGTVNITADGACGNTGGTAVTVTVTTSASITGGSTSPTILYTNQGAADSVVDSAGNAMSTWGAALTASDAAAPVIVSGNYRDSNGDGEIDNIQLYTTADTGMVCTGYTFTDLTVTEAGTVGVARGDGDACSSNGTSKFVITLITAGTNNTTGGVLDPVVTYTQPTNGLEDAAGNDVPTKAGLTLTDLASPVILSGTYADNDNSGEVDRVIFTTTADTGLACTAFTGATDLTVGTDGTVGVAVAAGDTCADNNTTTFTFTLATAGTTNTTGGSIAPIVTYTNPTNGLEDAAGNDVPTTSPAITLTDAARPVILSGTYTDNNNNGAVDRVTLTVSADTGLACTAFTGATDMTVVTPGSLTLAANIGDTCSDNNTSLFYIDLSTPGDANETSSATAPIITYTQPINGLEDGAGNDLVTYASLTLTDAASPTISAVTVNTSSGRNIVTVDYTETITVTGHTAGEGAATASATSLGDMTTNRTLAGIGSFATGEAASTTLLNSVQQTDSDTLVITICGQGGACEISYPVDGAPGISVSGVFTPSAGSVITDAVTLQVNTSRTPTASVSGAWDVAPPTVSVIGTNDGLLSGPDGVLDAIYLDFSEDVRDSSFTANDFDVQTVTGETVSTNAWNPTAQAAGTVDSDANDDLVSIYFTPGGTWATDATPTIAYTSDGATDANVTDIAGNPLANVTATSSTDYAGPAITGAATSVSGGGVTVNRLTFTFSEPVTVTDGNAGDGFPAISTLTASSGTATIDNANYSTLGTTLTLNVTPTATSNTAITLTPTYTRAPDGLIRDNSAQTNEMRIDETFAGTDGAAPVLVSATYLDSDGDGKIDSFTMTMSETVTAASVLRPTDLSLENVGDFTGAAFGSGTTDAITGSVSTATITLGTEATAVDTVNGGTLAISTQNGFSLTDGTNTNTTQAAQTQLSFVDGAGPALLSATYLDGNTNGTIDSVALAFSEAATLTYSDTDWTATANDLTSFGVSGYSSGNGTTTIVLTGTATANKTGVGSGNTEPTLAFSHATNLTDGTAYRTSISATSLADGALPQVVSKTYSDNGSNGSVDRLAIVFTEDVTWNGSDLTQFVAVAQSLTGFVGNPTAVSGSGTTTLTMTMPATTNLTGVSGLTEPTIAYTQSGTSGNRVKDESAATNALANFTAASITDAAAPVMISATYGDANTDGQIDLLTLAMTENTWLSYTDANWTATANGLTGFNVSALQSGTGTTSLVFTATATANITGVGSGTQPTIAFAHATNMDDVNSNYTTSISATSCLDGAKPQYVSSATGDADADGKIDSINITLSEPISDATLDSGLAVATYTGDATTTGASANDALIRATFTEGATADTDAVPTWTYTYTSIADASANTLANITTKTPTDGAIPVVTTWSPTSGAGGVSVSANAVVTFSEPMTTATTESAFSFSPTVNNAITWSDSDKVMTVNPTGNFLNNTTYTITIASTAPSAASGDGTLATSTSTFITTSGSSSGSGGGGGGGGSTTTTSLTITSPNGGNQLASGLTHNVTWGTGGAGVASIRLKLSSDGGLGFPTTIATGESNDGSYVWTVPTLTGSTYRLKIEGMNSTGDIVYTDISDANFAIGAAGSIPTPSTTPTTPTTSPTTGVDIPGVTSGATFSKTAASAASPSINVDLGITVATGTTGCTSGTLVKGTSFSAVYYCGADGKRYVFPNDKAYSTWYANFSGVLTISDTALANLSLGGIVTYKPGVKMIKIESDPKVYAVAPGGLLRWVTSEAIATSLYGTTWNRQIDDVPVSFFTRYTVGASITE